MLRRPILGALVSLVIVLLALVLLTARYASRAQPLLPSRADYENALWIAGTDGLLKIATADGSIVLEIPEAEEVRAVGVDELRGRVWAYGGGLLRAYGFDGALLLSVFVSPAEEDEAHVGLAVNLQDGTLWLGVHKIVQHVDAQGQVLQTIPLQEPVLALALDGAAGRTWVATKKALRAYNPAGQLVAEIALGKNPDVQDLAVDSGSGELWVALKKTLRLYDAHGALLVEAPLDKLERIASDGLGGLWAATQKDLLRLDAAGRVGVRLQPFGGQGGIVAIATDPGDGSVWVASQKALSHIDAAGVTQRQLDLHSAELGFEGRIQALALYADRIPPDLAFSSPSNDSLLNTNTPALTLSYTDVGSGVVPATLQIQADGHDLEVECTVGDAEASCTPADPFPEGQVSLTATIADQAGNRSAEVSIRFSIDTIPPQIALAAPQDGTLTQQAQQTFVGHLSEAARLTLNGQPVIVRPDLTFLHGPLMLLEGFNPFTLLATDAAGNVGRLLVHVTLDTTPPPPVELSHVQVSPVTAGQVRVAGGDNSVEAGSHVALTNRRTGQTVTVTATAAGGFNATLLAQSGDVVAISITDAAGNASAPVAVGVGEALPPDPGTVAPPLDRTVATDLATATAFLYTGPQPIQTGVMPGTIEPRRVAVLRGQVRDRQGAPVPGVTISVLGHPEFGQTRSRTDGLFDLAVNGGGRLTVRYEKAGYLPVQRQVEAPWRDYAWLSDVVLVAYDPQVTLIDLTAAADIQVAQGSVVTDARGQRQATLLFPPNTQATLRWSDGRSQPLTSLHVRATEYTVGDTGLQAMPAELPPSTGYTYAVEISVDEAVAAGASRVEFNPPVVGYVENFLEFPVGGVVPAGSYDREHGLWMPSQNGQVLRLLGVTGGLADLDTDGDTVADAAGALLALGITDAERQRLATLYPPGQRLWRVPLPHVTPWDFNWPIILPEVELDLAPVQQDPPLTCSTKKSGSILGVQPQTLGEALPLAGTPFSLVYQSDRVPGRTAERTLEIPLTGARVRGMADVYVSVTVGGQQVSQVLRPTPNLTYTVTWDGRDAYGRRVQGAQPVTIWIGQGFGTFYACPPTPGWIIGWLGRDEWFCAPFRSYYIRPMWQRGVVMGQWDATAQGLGGWTLDVHHAYDPIGQMLNLGDGGTRQAAAQAPVISAVAGVGASGFGGDGGPATSAPLSNPAGLAIGPDGSLYIADTDNHRVRRVRPDGIITTVAGTGSRGLSGDGGPATQATFGAPTGVAVGPDGSLYMSDTEFIRVRRIGSPLPGFALGDLFIPAPDGSEIYVFDSAGRHLRTLDPHTGALRYQFTYDGAGLLVGVTDGDGNVTTIERDAAGQPTAILAPFGQRTTLTPDTHGYLASLTTPVGETTTLTWTPDGLLISLTDPRGHIYQFAYDALGRLLQDADPAGGSTALARTSLSNGYAVTGTSALDRVTTYTVERATTGGTRRGTTDPSGLQTLTQINTNGSQVTTLPDGTSLSVVDGPDPRWGMTAPLPQSLTLATPSGLTGTRTTTRAVTLTDPSNPFSLLTQTDTLRLNGRPFTSVYGAGSRTRTTRTPMGRQTISMLDAQGRLVETQVLGLAPVQLSYDAHGRLATLTHGSGASPRLTRFSYTTDGYLETVEDALGRLVHFTSDAVGRVTAQTLPDGRVIGYTYDANGNVSSVTPPGRPAHAFSYTPVNLEEAYLPPTVGPENPVTQYTYNADRQLTLITRPDRQTVPFAYDGAGRLSTVTLPRGQVRYDYDPTTGQLTTLTAPDGGTLTFGYDGTLLADTTWSGSVVGSIHLTYDANFHLTAESVNGGQTIAFEYDDDDLLTVAGTLRLSRHPHHGLIAGTALAQVIDTRTYDSFGELVSYRAIVSGSDVFTFQVERDALGRILQKTETIEGQTDRYTYGYDVAGRLTEVAKNGTTIATYVYDSNGNRLQSSGPGGTLNGRYDAQDRLLQYGSATYTYTVNGDLLTKTASTGTTAYAYDALGNLLNQST